ncbi:hypothetical protein [Sulfurimonas sp.]|uniref:hypothetical protein n=1 Tax=Sulfurimonas sp. TaxID=2022749 RepID=UPI002B460999|nr:hypothetical protein [Sulfurimonas sp.]
MILKKRRTFLKLSALGLSSCLLTSTGLVASSTIDTLALAQQDLYGDFKDAPKFDELNARAYLSLILTHTRVSESAIRYIKNGARWLDEEAMLLYKKVYISLSFKERQKTLKSISKEEWGEEWIYEMLSFVYEALLGDTIYGINKNESGWKWLHHASGLPRPKKVLL